uniref:Uncharacterized protein n=1 Tax=Arundo donax TaxID=35708 RepID=A0A0A9FRN2_ARUDO
MSNIWLIS